MFSFLLDNEAPMLDCYNVRSVTDTGVDYSTNVEFNITATDNVDQNSSVTCSPSSNEPFSVGDTSVTCWSVDDAGNNGTCDFVVTVTGNIVK